MLLDGKGADQAFLPPADNKIARDGEEVTASRAERHPGLRWRCSSQPQGTCLAGDTREVNVMLAQPVQEHPFLRDRRCTKMGQIM